MSDTASQPTLKSKSSLPKLRFKKSTKPVVPPLPSPASAGVSRKNSVVSVGQAARRRNSKRRSSVRRSGIVTRSPKSPPPPLTNMAPPPAKSKSFFKRLTRHFTSSSSTKTLAASSSKLTALSTSVTSPAIVQSKPEPTAERKPPASPAQPATPRDRSPAPKPKTPTTTPIRPATPQEQQNLSAWKYPPLPPSPSIEISNATEDGTAEDEPQTPLIEIDSGETTSQRGRNISREDVPALVADEGDDGDSSEDNNGLAPRSRSRDAHVMSIIEEVAPPTETTEGTVTPKKKLSVVPPPQNIPQLIISPIDGLEAVTEEPDAIDPTAVDHETVNLAAVDPTTLPPPASSTTIEFADSQSPTRASPLTPPPPQTRARTLSAGDASTGNAKIGVRRSSTFSRLFGFGDKASARPTSQYVSPASPGPSRLERGFSTSKRLDAKAAALPVRAPTVRMMSHQEIAHQMDAVRQSRLMSDSSTSGPAAVPANGAATTSPGAAKPLDDETTRLTEFAFF